MKIRKEFKDDMKTYLKWITIIFSSIVFVGCIYYSYAHFLMDILRLPTLPTVNKDIDPKNEGLVFVHTFIYTMLFYIVYLVYEILKKIKNYIFE